jgi:outer membrane lipopolysaccharide assembly protein LptE/RlpB
LGRPFVLRFDSFAVWFAVRGFHAKDCDNGEVRVRLAGLLFLCAMLSGCGYHTAGSATHVPPNVRTLAVPIFANKTQAYQTEIVFTGAVIHELNARTKYEINSAEHADADATLHGTILSQSIAPLTYDTATGQSSSYLITITAAVSLTARDGRVLYANNKLTYRQQYQSTQDLASFIQEDSPAVNRLAKDFAAAVVSDMLESF